MKSSSAMVTTQSLSKVIASGKKNDVRLMTEVEKPKSLVEVRAEEIQFGLDPQFPSLVKLMLRSHVVQGFWLGLTSKFCSRLPKNDSEVTLVGEDGEEYTANYLSHKFGLSGGWRGFATAHKLVEGDALVFQLVEATKFKVYIVRAHSLVNVDVTSSLLKSGIPAKGSDQADAEERKMGIKYTRKHIPCRPAVPLIGEDQHIVPPLKSCKETKMTKSPAQKHIKSHLSVPFLGDNQDATLPIAGPKETTATDDPIRKRVKFHPSVLHLGGDQNITLPLSSSRQAEDRKVIDTEVLEGIKLSDSSVEIQDVTDLESFTVTVNGLIIDPEMSENYRSKYYELCCSQKTYLHKNLMQGVNSKLVAGIICETVDIADAIRASELGTPKDDFKAWRKSLIGFKHLGMIVDVLLSRIDILLKLVTEAEHSLDYNETMIRLNRFKREIAALDMKILELRNESVRLEGEVKALQVSEEKHEAFYSVVETSPKKKKARTTKSIIEIEKPKSLAEEQAEEIQSNLDPKFPSFIKLMVPSQVSGGFWMGLPAKFCSSNLPKSDTKFTLVDEDGEEYTANYLPRKLGLSGGWKGFAVAHKLLEGDALVFHLVDVSIFKVYIVRSYTSPDLLKLECNTGGSDTGAMDKKNSKKGAQKCVKFHPSIVLEEDENIDVPSEGSHQPEDCSGEEVTDSDVPEGIKLLGYMDEFQEMKNLESFTVAVNDLAIDFEIPEHIQSKYYELCRSQNTSLHKDLVMGSNSTLVVGIISEVVNLAEGIRACKLSTPREELKAWENNLKAFKQLGMNVGFLLSRVGKLLELSSKLEQAFDLKRYNEAMEGTNRVNGEITTLGMKILELRNDSMRFDREIKTLKLQAEKHELAFKNEVSSPW